MAGKSTQEKLIEHFMTEIARLEKEKEELSRKNDELMYMMLYAFKNVMIKDDDEIVIKNARHSSKSGDNA